MRKTNLCSHNNNAKLCAGCGQPYVVSTGWSQAIVGQDNRLDCYATPCEAGAATGAISNRAALARGAASHAAGISSQRYCVNIGRPPVCTMSEVGSGSAVSDVSLLMTRSPLPTKRNVSPM